MIKLQQLLVNNKAIWIYVMKQYTCACMFCIKIHYECTHHAHTWRKSVSWDILLSIWCIYLLVRSPFLSKHVTQYRIAIFFDSILVLLQFHENTIFILFTSFTNEYNSMSCRSAKFVTLMHIYTCNTLIYWRIYTCNTLITSSFFCIYLG